MLGYIQGGLNESGYRSVGGIPFDSIWLELHYLAAVLARLLDILDMIVLSVLFYTVRRWAWK